MKKQYRYLIVMIAVLCCLFSAQLTAHAATFKLPDSGQTKCYEAVSPYGEIPCAGTGQDGAYSINPMSFTDNNDGTVTDNNTGLVWQKCSVGQNNDATCSGTATTHNWYQASGTYDATNNASTQNVCGSLDLAGGGWRLPSREELMNILDYSIPLPGPTIQQNWFPNTLAYGYMASTTFAGDTSKNWSLDLYDGFSYYGFKYNNKFVRCVRGAQ